MNTNRSAIIMFGVICLLTSGCKKYLAEKSNKGFVVMSTLDDCQALLDFNNVVNFNDPSSGEISSGDFYLRPEDWSALYMESEQRMYTWQKDHVFETGGGNDWDYLYRPVYYANLTLETLAKINPHADQERYDNVMGQALFWRAKCFFQGVQLWSMAYDPQTSASALGIPLRLISDFNQRSVRASVEETYVQIMKDLQTAIAQLPDRPLHVLRPSRPAACAMLARVYLAMGIYDSCLKYSNACLSIKSDLMDYNSDPDIDAAAQYPFKRFNKEVIFCSALAIPNSLYRGYVDTVLYNAYSETDWRKSLFFDSSPLQGFRGNYEAGGNWFTGIATDEVYLMRAECYARLKNVSLALPDLNSLLAKRMQTGSFTPLATTDPDLALDWILAERRKELVFRGIRWMDLKRLNRDGRNISLSRTINGQQFTLPPNDLRYALPIPDDIISLSGMQQNPR